MKTAGVARVMTRVTLKSVFETNKSPLCIKLMILYVFQHKLDIFRLIDVIVCNIFFSGKFLTTIIIDITIRDTRSEECF